MLGQRPRRWANISPTLGHRLVFAGFLYKRFVSGGGAEEWDYIRSFKYCYNHLKKNLHRFFPLYIILSAFLSYFREIRTLIRKLILQNLSLLFRSLRSKYCVVRLHILLFFIFKLLNFFSIVNLCVFLFQRFAFFFHSFIVGLIIRRILIP